ncbi:MAG: hypothetical protein P4L35_14150, partial [Ignavibacteriaceae bacterium]|nr:hypothetical protein [Ignavibacteriaceae bacterium]
MPSISYLDILHNLKEGRSNRSELKLLIENTSGIAYRFALSKYLSTLKKHFETDSLIKDFAFDSIVPLFVIKNDQSETGLEKSLKNWNLE